MIALGLDLGDLRIDAGCLFALRDGDLILDSLRALLHFLIDIGDNVLGEVQHTVEGYEARYPAAFPGRMGCGAYTRYVRPESPA